MENTTLLLTTFLRTLATDIENGKLPDDKLQQVGEFFMTFLFLQDLEKNKKSDKDFLKFMTMGWYVYNNLQKS
jgi:hypothetical protein